MNIVADENMPLVKSCFGDYGEIIFLPGRAIKSEDLIDADILLVRSVTKVNKSLLDGSKVKFVGSATIGVDHIDLDYLRLAGIHFANAPGCNANGVVQYIFSVLCALGVEWSGKQVGIIGCGNVGGRFYQKMKMMGVECLCYDPFLSSEQNSDLCRLEQVLQADIISMHTPYTDCGPYPTRHMLNRVNLPLLSPDAVLINAGRGPAIHNLDLLHFLKQRDDVQVVLDVWEHEPVIEDALMAMVKIATPHIAGYSKEGKENGTRMIRDALLRWRGCSPPGEEPQGTLMTIEASSVPQAVLAAYDVMKDDQRTRLSLSGSGVESARLFDQLRKTYPVRPEFSNYLVQGVDDKKQRTQLDCLGFVTR